MTPAHIIYIPLILIVGVLLGYRLGAAALRRELERRRKSGEDI